MSTMSTLSALTYGNRKFSNTLLRSNEIQKEKKWGANNFGLTWLTRMAYTDLSFIKIKEKKKEILSSVFYEVKISCSGSGLHHLISLIPFQIVLRSFELSRPSPSS
jgi:hypothetical protein